MGEGWWGVPLDGVSSVYPIAGVVFRYSLEEIAREVWSDWTGRGWFGGVCG